MVSMAASAFEGFDQMTQKRSLITRGSMSSSSEISFPPYEVVPATRPIVVMGPSLRGYEVTDLMHRALYNFLKKRFPGRISVYRTHADIGLSKRTFKANPTEKERFNITKGGSPRMTAEVQKEVERIYDLTKGLNMVVIDCDVMNHPSQLTDCSLAPIAVYIKMDPGILEKLVKLRGSKRKNLGAQVVAAQKLAQCNEEMFDLVLDEAIFEDACEHLGEFLDQYWRDLHPNDSEDGVGPITEKVPLLQGPSGYDSQRLESIASATKGLPAGNQGNASPSKPSQGQKGQGMRQNTAGTRQGKQGVTQRIQQQGGQKVSVPQGYKEDSSNTGSRQGILDRDHSQQRKKAVTGNAPDFGKKLHEAFEAHSKTAYMDSTEYQAGYEAELQYDQQQYYSQGGHYDHDHYGSDMYGHQQAYMAEPYPQEYPEQHRQDTQYGYEQYGQDFSQGYSHAFENDNQYGNQYYDQDPGTTYEQNYSSDIQNLYPQRHEWYDETATQYGRDGYYQ